MKSINPATGQVLREYPEPDQAELMHILGASQKAFPAWKQTGFVQRAEHMQRAAHLLRERSAEYARLMAEEMGKPVRAGKSEAEKCAWVCEYYAKHAASFLQDEVISTDASRSFVTFQPLGTILAVMPWNFPFWQVFRFAAPTLMAGNVGVLKHASNVPGCAVAIEKVFRDAGFPPDVFRTLLIRSDRVGEVIDHPGISAVTLTGSTPAGRTVAARAGAALKKSVLELGGSDPYIILEDAHLDDAVQACVSSRLINSGQSCIAAKRFIVVQNVMEKFVRQFVETMSAAVVGDPLDPRTTVGPQARHDLRDDLHRQVTESIRQGARCILGGEIPEGPGAFYPPTVLTGVKKGMPAYDEELFGPVASIIRAVDEHEAIALANDSAFGLGAAVFTRDTRKGESLAATAIEAGNCFVNAFVKSDPRLPFGGVKGSGYGRELGPYGIKEFVNIKTVYLQ
jgi:succinate-semialdehyde dehydrogenase/glutarate-semialdehyde dehydrogenase